MPGIYQAILAQGTDYRRNSALRFHDLTLIPESQRTVVNTLMSRVIITILRQTCVELALGIPLRNVLAAVPKLAHIRCRC